MITAFERMGNKSSQTEYDKNEDNAEQNSQEQPGLISQQTPGDDVEQKPGQQTELKSGEPEATSEAELEQQETKEEGNEDVTLKPSSEPVKLNTEDVQAKQTEDTLKPDPSPKEEDSPKQSPTSARKLLTLKSTDHLAVPAAEDVSQVTVPQATFSAEGNVPQSFFTSPHNTQKWALKDVQARRYFSI